MDALTFWYIFLVPVGTYLLGYYLGKIAGYMEGVGTAYNSRIHNQPSPR